MALSTLAGAATLTVKVGDFNTFVAALNAELEALTGALTAAASTILTLTDRIAALENQPLVDHGHGALDERVAALENLIVRSPAEAPVPITTDEHLPRPENLDDSEVELVYNRATLYYHGMELHADRIGSNRWRLYAQLNYITVTQILWTYDEIVEGTLDEVYAHAYRRLQELAELKPQHDAVHERVREMSEGVE